MYSKGPVGPCLVGLVGGAGIGFIIAEDELGVGIGAFCGGILGAVFSEQIMDSIKEID